MKKLAGNSAFHGVAWPRDLAGSGIRTGDACARRPKLSEIEVLAKRVNARNRVDTPAPMLVLRRGVFPALRAAVGRRHDEARAGRQFQSDIGEYAAPSLRGIGTEYTQVLINGRRSPAATNDNTVVVDRIPAELVERVEIIRSPISDIDSQGIGGTLNIILKEGAELTGGIYRLGGYYIDGETDPARSCRSATATSASNGAPRSTTRSASIASRRRARAGAGRRGRRRARVHGRVEDPDERETRTSPGPATCAEARRGPRVVRGRLYMDTDRAETEFGREFEAEDDDGELDDRRGAGQPARCLPRAQLRMFAGLRAAFGDGHSWEVELSYDQTEFESK